MDSLTTEKKILEDTTQVNSQEIPIKYRNSHQKKKKGLNNEIILGDISHTLSPLKHFRHLVQTFLLVWSFIPDVKQ